MTTVTEKRALIASYMKKLAELDAKAIQENRELTEAELALKNETLDKVSDLQNAVTIQLRQEKTAKDLENTDGPVTIEKKKIPAASFEVRDKDKFPTFGAQLSAVMRAGLPGGHADPRLFNAATGANETTPSEGGSWFSRTSQANCYRKSSLLVSWHLSAAG
jgi:hypothetical protein